jgi:putative intracellular protease/amidase
MKKLIIILSTILSIVMPSTFVMAADAPKVLLIPRDGEIVAHNIDSDTALTKETILMKNMIEKAGFKVVVATTDGLPIKGSTVILTPDLKLSDVKVDDYVGVINACKAVGSLPTTTVSPLAVSIVKQAVAQGKPVAASHGAVIILAEAGVLVGKRYGYPYDPLGIGRRPDDRFTGAIYGGTGVVQDGKIITCAACPDVAAGQGLTDGTAELTQAFITALTPKK